MEAAIKGIWDDLMNHNTPMNPVVIYNLDNDTVFLDSLLHDYRDNEVRIDSEWFENYFYETDGEGTRDDVIGMANEVIEGENDENEIDDRRELIA